MKNVVGFVHGGQFDLNLRRLMWTERTVTGAYFAKGLEDDARDLFGGGLNALRAVSDADTQ